MSKHVLKSRKPRCRWHLYEWSDQTFSDDFL